MKRSLTASIIFLCAGTATTGAGHLSRGLALAEAYRAAGWRLEFIVTGDTFGHLFSPGYVWQVAKPGETLDVIRRVAPNGCDVVVIDDYERDASFEVELRDIARCIIVLDDQTGRRHRCDVLIDAAAQDAGAYRDLVGHSTRILAGPRFALVRSEILSHRRQAIEARGDHVRNILLTFGATDPGGLSLKLIDAVAQLMPQHIALTIALSSSARDIEAIRSRISGSDRFQLLIDADMGEVIAAADLAVGAGGVGAYERAALGLPGVVVTAVDNQRGVARQLVEAHASLDGGEPDANLISRVIRQLAALVDNAALRRDMSVAAASLVDGRAASRIHLACAPAIKLVTGVEVRLRLAESQDADWLLALQREPKTRRFARNPEMPSREQHVRWLDSIFARRESVLAIVETNGESSGMVRLDGMGSFGGGPQQYEVSIAISTALHGRGIGSAALQLIRAIYPGAILNAFVLSENDASLRIFLKAGYTDAGNGFYRSVPESLAAEPSNAD